MGRDGRLDRAEELYERAVFGGDPSAITAAERALDEVEADLCLARGRLLHARFLADHHEDTRELEELERAAELYRRVENLRGEAEALFWIGAFYQVVRQDTEGGLPALRRSRDLAAQVGDAVTLSYAVRHLGFAELSSGRFAEARTLLEESARLRKEVNFLPGYAAALLALAMLSVEEGDRPGAVQLLDEAQAVSESCGADGVLSWVQDARSRL